MGYDDIEDRVWLKTGDHPTYWIPRRLLGRFIAKAGSRLETTVPGGSIPNALPPEKRILIDHAEALSDTPEGQPVMPKNRSPSPSKTEACPRVTTTMTISAKDTDWQIGLVSADGTVHFSLNRLGLHRFLGALIFAVKQADWGLEGIPQWLSGSADTSTN